MISTVVVVLLTHNLAYGVLLGIVLSAIFFASTLKFIGSFDFTEEIKFVDIDLSRVKIWDESAVDVIDKVVFKFHKNGVKVNLIGMSNQCLELVDRMAVHNKPGALGASSSH
ncbi:STAS domain-containing protein [Clostridium gelidum]|nr:STAS domain-containing protein [Clostridium gelidum]